MYAIINLNKEKDISSFKQIKMLKSIFINQKIGHTGTLDPLAQGVLVVCIGKATRLADYIQSQTKTYQAELLLGFSTDSYDITGKITDVYDISDITDEMIRKTILSFKGIQNQKPPIYSAKKVNGKKLYQYALQDKKVDIKDSVINIYDISLDSITDDYYQEIKVKKVIFTIYCSKGTYIRSLCNDIGEILETGGTMSNLTRKSVGNFKIENSYTINEIIEFHENKKLNDIFTPIEDAISLDTLIIKNEDLKKYLNGIKIQTNFKSNEYIIKDEQKTIIGIGIVDSFGILKGKVMLYESNNQ